MARINIDTGTLGNPATGDTLRTAMTKINTNFTEVYSLVRDGSSGLIATDVTNGDLKLQANGTGSIEIDTLSVQNSTITSITTNSDITLTPNGTGNVVLGNFTFNADQTVGASEDNYVFTYDHSTGTIGLEAAAAGGVTASSTTTFTNKTFDANGTGNSISNIDIADFTSGVFLDEDNMASNSATAIASQQSIKAYVDAEDANIASDSMTFTNKSGNISQWTNDSNYATQAYVDARDIGDLSVVGSTISAPSNADLTLTTSGTGSVSIDGIQISGTELSSTDSTQITIKENLHVTGNISGTITGTVTGTIDADSSTVSNLEVDNFKASAIVIESEGIGSNDNDTTIPTSAAVKDYVDTNSVTASESATFTNKTFDANGTGNSISNIEVADFAAASIVTEGEGIGSNDNDTTIPTSAAVKDYVDSNPTTSLAADNLTTGDASITITTTTGDITLDTQESNRDIIFKGTDGGVDITPLQLDMSEGGKAIFQADIQGQGVTISDNTITSNRSNDNLELAANGTGNVKILTDQITLGTGSSAGTEAVAIGKNTNAGNYAQAIGNNAGNSGQGQGAVALGSEAGETDQGNKAVAIGNYAGETTQGANAIAIGEKAGQTSQAANSIVINATGAALNNTTASSMVVKPIRNASGTHQLEYNPTTGEVTYDTLASGGATGDLAITGSTISAPSNADLTLTTSGTGSVSVDGIQIKGTEISSSDSTQVTIKENLNVTGTITGSGAGIFNVQTIAVNDESSDTTCFPLFSTGATSLSSGLSVKTDQSSYKYNASTGTLEAVGFTATGSSTFDGVQITDNKVTSASSNADLELDGSGTGGIIAQSPFTFNAGYIEKINTLTSSSTITVDCASASIHTVTLGTATEFNITNLPTGGSVTLIITQDGTGGRTATFGTDGSSAVKFPSNSSTLSTGAGDIDVVTIINDGTNFLGNIAKDYRSS